MAGAPLGDHGDLMQAAQLAAGVLAARQRGDHEGAARLMSAFDDADQLVGGSMLLAQLSLGLYARISGQEFDDAAQELCVQLEAAVGS